ARLVYNRAQKEELDEKGLAYVEMFCSFGDAVAAQLEGVELRAPDELYEGETALDLGGMTAELREVGPAHTRGDQIIFLPAQRVLFAGDLVETRFFPIFPPEDADVTGARWIEVLRQLEALEPTLVVPGHGEVGGPEVMRSVRAYLEDVQGRVRHAVQAGRDVATAHSPTGAGSSARCTGSSPQAVSDRVGLCGSHVAGVQVVSAASRTW